MNDSGGAVSTLAKYYDIEPEQVIVVHDEIDLAVRAARVKFGGGDNGHNGLETCASRSAPVISTGCELASAARRGRLGVHDHVLKAFSLPSARSCRSTSRRPPTPSRA